MTMIMGMVRWEGGDVAGSHPETKNYRKLIKSIFKDSNWLDFQLIPLKGQRIFKGFKTALPTEK